METVGGGEGIQSSFAFSPKTGFLGVFASTSDREPSHAGLPGSPSPALLR